MSLQYDREFLKKLLSTMYLGRKFEERVQWLFSQGLVHGTTHLAIGEEATAVGTISALKEQDYVFGTHRGHVQALAKGLDVKAVMAEILAKDTGVCRGIGGSMHIADPDRFYYGADGILGASAVMAGGAALAVQKRGERDRVVVVFFGDGTSNEGATFEAFNLASVWSLPILFVCVNNTYGMSTHISKVMKDTDISKRAIPFGMPGKNVDGNDVLAVYEAVCQARQYVLNNGPMLLVLNTYRTCGHSKSDGNLYRTKEEIAAWKEKCPIKLFREKLTAHGFLDSEMDEIASATEAQVNDAVVFAKESCEPSMEHLLGNVFA